MIEIYAQRAPEVSSIVFLILIFAGYNQRAIKNGRWIYCVETQPSYSNSMEQIVPPFYNPEMSFTLVLSWFCLGWPAVVLYGAQPAMTSDSYGPG